MKPLLEPFGDDVVCLRLLEERDLGAILEWRNRDDTRVWFKTTELISYEAHCRWYSGYLKKPDDLVFVVEVSKDPAGMCAIYNIDYDRSLAEVGRFVISPGFAGQGYMKRACAALVAMAHKKLQIHSLYLEVKENNEPAIAVYTACGFWTTGRCGDLITMRCDDRSRM
ncbi:GNAT family N-acetyltransferase [Bradyrhizobium sp. SZCCHNRI3037]|uniref:GNAT family N-acetyltransferase n=1 Tax=Bradyrhizobium sp. SZCCHNRI3037 TaxID=3057290 RepID=UPI0029169936|nr:GNAT family N-acetyltransferase [Bradyrhizobium sp. SZCCHNRI3037]